MGQGRVIIHDIRHDMLGDGLEQSVPSSSLAALSSRAILLADAHDHVVVSEQPDRDWIACLKSVGLGESAIYVPEINGDATLIDRVLADQPLMETMSAQCNSVHPYMGSDDAVKLASTLGLPCVAPDPRSTRTLNAKVSLNAILERAELPRIQTDVVTKEKVVDAVSRLIREHVSPLIVRADVSIGGHGVWALRTLDDIEALRAGAASSTPDRLFLIQPMLEVSHSPNVQFWVNPRTGPELVGVSDQTLTQSLAFVGNTCPSVAPCVELMISQSRTLAEQLFHEGYLGYLGVDFVVTPQGDPYIIEINPRVNTSTFAHAIAQRCGVDHFELAVSLPCTDATPCGLFGPELYSVETGVGVVPLTPHANSAGFVDLVVLGGSAEQVSETTHRVRENACGATP